MKGIFTFEKMIDDRWFVVLPEWDGDKDDLEMVLGADTMLDILSQGDNKISITIATEPSEDYIFKLTKKDKNCNEGGAWYDAHSDLFDFEVWLCHVNKFVFGDHPEFIYIC